MREHILSLPHVNGVHDLHASQLGTGLPVLTAHVVVEEDCFRHGDLPAMLDRLQSCVAEPSGLVVEHSTFQLEPVGHEGHESAAHAEAGPSSLPASRGDRSAGQTRNSTSSWLTRRW